MKKRDKTKYKKLPEEKKQYVEVLIEDMNHKFDVLIEGHTVHSGEFKKIHATLDSHTKTLASHSEMIGSMLTDIEVIKEDLNIIKGDLKQKVDRSEFSTLERRVLLLEKHARGGTLAAHR